MQNKKVNCRQVQECCLCRRSVIKMTRHHLVPRMVSGRSSIRRRLEAEKKSQHEILMLCLPCHRQIHRIFNEKELALCANSLEKLETHPKVKKFVAWVQKQSPETIFPCRK